MSSLIQKPEFINRLSPEKQSQLILEHPKFLTHLDHKLEKDPAFLKALLLDSSLETFKKFYNQKKPRKDLISMIEKNPENEGNNAHRLEVALSSDPKCIYLLMAVEKDLNLLSKLSQYFSQPIEPTIISSLGNQQLLILLEKSVINLGQIPENKFKDPKFILGLSSHSQLLELAFQENKVSFKDLDEDLRKNLSVARIACKIDLANIEHVHSELKDDPEFLKSIGLEEGLLIKILKCFGVHTFSAWLYNPIESNSDSKRGGPSY